MHTGILQACRDVYSFFNIENDQLGSFSNKWVFLPMVFDLKKSKEVYQRGGLACEVYTPLQAFNPDLVLRLVFF